MWSLFCFGMALADHGHPPPTVTCRNPNPLYYGIHRWFFVRWVGQETGVLMMGLVPLAEKTEERRSLFTARGHRKKVAICSQTRKRALTRQLDLQTPRSWASKPPELSRKKCWLFKPASAGYLVNSSLNWLKQWVWDGGYKMDTVLSTFSPRFFEWNSSHLVCFSHHGKETVYPGELAQVCIHVGFLSPLWASHSKCGFWKNNFA